MNSGLAAVVRAVACVLCIGSTAGAQLTFVTQLTNAAEPGNIQPTTDNGLPRVSFGTATFFLNSNMTALTFSAVIVGIDLTGTQTPDVNDNLTNAHIHAGTSNTAATFGVVWGFIGTPFNDDNPRDVIITPFATGVGGTISGKWDAPEGNNTTLTAQLPNILAGRAYINFHTRQFVGGEVRGTIVTPEPATMLLMGSGLAGIGLVARARRRRSNG
jgi:hypothetical protein